MATKLKVNEPSAAVLAMRAEFAMLEALMGGTRKMRALGAAALPKFPQEDPDSYTARLGTATLFPAYRRTVRVMVGKPFSKELNLTEATPVQIRGERDKKGQRIKAGWADDIDCEGVSLHVFAAEMFEESFYGLAGILVEAPKPIETGGRPASIKEQNEAGIRPYFVRIMHSQILGWQTAKFGSARKLTQFRFMECVTEPDAGGFGEVEIEQVRVLYRGRWETYRETGTGARRTWTLHDEGASAITDIPFVPLYGVREGFMSGSCPLIDLAFLNVKHWQSQSDQDTILHVARVPVLFAKGFAETDQIVVGANTAVQTSNSAADLKFVEHTGASIDAGAKSLDQLEQQMIQSGAELLVNKPGAARTATEDNNDAEGNKSDLQRMVENYEDALNMALDFMSQFGGLPRTGSVDLYKAFGETSLGTASSTLIKELMVAGKLSDETGLNELKRRGELAPEVDAQDEVDRIEAQGPALGLLPPAPGEMTPPAKKPVPA